MGFGYSQSDPHLKIENQILSPDTGYMVSDFTTKRYDFCRIPQATGILSDLLNIRPPLAVWSAARTMVHDGAPNL
jgi:hypothetical protein